MARDRLHAKEENMSWESAEVAEVRVCATENERRAEAAKSEAPARVNEVKIRKVPPGLRRDRRLFREQRSAIARLRWRLQHDTQFLRTTVQAAFVLLCVWIGIEFHLFVQWGMTNGTSPYVTRPPGVEGFLPISALISLKYWIEAGIVNSIHPSGLFILIAILLTGIFLKKAFCGWLCPIGTLSESLWMLGEKLFRRTFKITKWIDIPLRSLKYLLLLFFVNAIWQMDVNALRTFIESPYNRMADVKMYLFFANISSFALWTIVVLIVLSVIVKNFWCRYLCPYGALLGALSVLSPWKITRSKDTCIDCELCTKACPADIPVHKVARVWSDECMACYRCVDVCPVKNTLDVRSMRNTRPVPGWVFGSLVVGVFVAVTGLAILAGVWQNSIGKEEYLRRFQELNTPAYEHFGAQGQ
jgi:ferredoxin